MKILISHQKALALCKKFSNVFAGRYAYKYLRKCGGDAYLELHDKYPAIQLQYTKALKWHIVVKHRQISAKMLRPFI